LQTTRAEAAEGAATRAAVPISSAIPAEIKVFLAENM
jgi:hypothetical protein